MSEKGNRSNTALKNLRVNFVLKLLIYGVRTRDIFEACKECTGFDFNCSERAIENYIHQCKNIIEKKNENSNNYYLNRSIQRFDDLYLHAYKLQDYRTAASINEQLDKLLGLMKQNINLSGEIKFGNIELNNEMIKKLSVLQNELN